MKKWDIKIRWNWMLKCIMVEKVMGKNNEIGHMKEFLIIAAAAIIFI